MSSCLLGGLFPGAAAGQSFDLFTGTFYPLQVHYVQGEQAGPTVMVQGGAQGDEVTGVLTADILRRSRVKRGNLIVIPRANVPALDWGRRQVNVDLNRRFDRDYAEFYEDILARAIKFFAARSDGLVHLHEGSGFYSPQYINSSRNPGRFGQSVIIDCTAYSGVPDLGEMASRAIDRVNPRVIPSRYVFTLFNTRTFDQDTEHSEQRKSLTFHTVSNLRKPAMAVEVSKDIRDLGWKVKQQLSMTCELLDNMGVVVEPPEDAEKRAASWYNGSIPLEINGRSLEEGGGVALKRMSVLRVGLTRETKRSWSVSPAGMPEINLLTSEAAALTDFDHLRVAVDGRAVKEVPVHWTGPKPEGAGKSPILVYSLNGRLRFSPPGGDIPARPGDSLFIHGLWGEKGREVLNIKGYVSDLQNNDGQDKHSRFVLFREQFIDRYIQEDGRGFKAKIVRETPGKPENEWLLRVRPDPAPQVFCRRGREWRSLITDRENRVPPGTYTLTAPDRKHILYSLPGHIGPVQEPRLSLQSGQRVDVEVMDARTFEPMEKILIQANGEIRPNRASNLKDRVLYRPLGPEAGK
ncbi:MAG: M99 family carboxypeptidase catalytic domain-containing protein [Desulfonatronovibrionaceae bacterium]